jgi:hypothetical protein
MRILGALILPLILLTSFMAHAEVPVVGPDINHGAD